MFQQGALFSSLTVRQNIQFPLRENLELSAALLDELATAKLEMVGLHARDGDKYPAEISGGMTKLARALALDPRYASALFGRGLAYEKKARSDFDAYLNEGKYENLAIRDYDEAIRLNPKNAVAFNNRGVTFELLRQYERAIEDYEEAIRLDPNSGLYLANRGDAFRITGKYAQAIADYRKGLTMQIDGALKKRIETALKELGVPNSTSPSPPAPAGEGRSAARAN